MRTKALVAILFLGCLSFTVSAQKNIDKDVIKNINERIAQSEETHILPEGGKLANIIIEDNSAFIRIDLPMSFLQKMDDMEFEEILEHFLPILPNLGVESYFFQTKNNLGEYIALEEFIDDKDLSTTPQFEPNRDIDLLGTSKGGIEEYNSLASEVAASPLPLMRPGALAGKLVWLSAGHGWHYKDDKWKTQRLNSMGLVEDFGTIEAVNYYLLKYLEQAGAKVWTVRERDMNTNEIIVDDESAGYKETGRWTKSSSTGWNKNYRYIYSKGRSTASAIYTPNIQEAGWYWVSTYFRQGGNRSKDARYVVKHAGGETTVSVNQESHGMTWVYLGQFYFEKGTAGNVTLINQSSDVGQAVIADAVRFGGGKGSIPNEKGRKSNKPRFEESALFYTQFQGYEKAESDVTVRPQYAEWELAKGPWSERNNAIYVSWHTNAGGGTGTGTETFMYNGKTTIGSKELRNAIHGEVVNAIKQEWNPEWIDRGVKNANFGELRKLKTMPGALIEIGFHDHVDDVKALQSPEFRNLAARAVYKGIVKYYAAKDGKIPVFLPEPPTHVLAKNTSTGKIQVQWKVPAYGGVKGSKATAYKVYLGTHGKAFGEGVITRNASFTFDNLEPSKTYYVKVTGINAGGESFDSPIVAVRTPSLDKPQVPFLIVDGFDRLDRGSAIKQYDGSYVGTTTRLFIDRMNSYDYAVQHAKGLSYANVSFDGATNEAVADGLLSMSNYKAVDWFLGEESNSTASLDEKERSLVASYLSKGGNLMISGSELAYDLGRSNGVSPYFYKKYLKAAYVNDDAETYNFITIKDSWGNPLKGGIDNAKNGIYNVEYPDIIKPYGGSKPILYYSGGKGGVAAVAYQGNDFRLMNFGFPIEAVYNENVRNDMFVRAARFLLGESNFEELNDYSKIGGLKGGGTKKGADDGDSKTQPKPLPPTTPTGGINVNEMPNEANITPRMFRNKITVRVGNQYKGKAYFVLLDKDRRPVVIYKWKQKSGRAKTLQLNNTLPVGVYYYELRIKTDLLKGQLIKKS